MFSIGGGLKELLFDISICRARAVGVQTSLHWSFSLHILDRATVHQTVETLRKIRSEAKDCNWAFGDSRFISIQSGRRRQFGGLPKSALRMSKAQSDLHLVSHLEVASYCDKG